MKMRRLMGTMLAVGMLAAMAAPAFAVDATKVTATVDSVAKFTVTIPAITTANIQADGSIVSSPLTVNVSDVILGTADNIIKVTAPDNITLTNTNDERKTQQIIASITSTSSMGRFKEYSEDTTDEGTFAVKADALAATNTFFMVAGDTFAGSATFTVAEAGRDV